MIKKELTTIQAEELHRTILNDPQIRALEAQLFKICSIATPQTVLKKNGDIGTVLLGSGNDPRLQLIKDSIDSRKQYISNAYCSCLSSTVLPPVYDGRILSLKDSDEHKKACARALELAKPEISVEDKKAVWAQEHAEAFTKTPKFIAAIDPYNDWCGGSGG